MNSFSCKLEQFGSKELVTKQKILQGLNRSWERRNQLLSASESDENRILYLFESEKPS